MVDWGLANLAEPGGCLTNVSWAFQNNIEKIYNARNHIYSENFTLKFCMCALGTRTKFQLEILILSTNSAIHKFWENILVSSWNVSGPEPGYAYILRNLNLSSLVRVMVCHQFGAKPLSEPKKLSEPMLIWVRLRNCGCLVTWFCYQLIAKPGNKTATVPWPEPYIVNWIHREKIH